MSIEGGGISNQTEDTETERKEESEEAETTNDDEALIDNEDIKE